MLQAVADQEPWEVQLQELYPEHPHVGVQALADSYLNEILVRSDSPVAMLVWKPTLADRQWAQVIIQSKLIADVGERRAFLAQHSGSTGHAALLWRREGDRVGYASFWPAPLLAAADAPGQFRTFQQDLAAESRLPDCIRANLNSSVQFIGRDVEGWDVQALEARFGAISAAPPQFDMKSRDGGKNCSTMVLDLVEHSCITNSTRTMPLLRGLYRDVKRSPVKIFFAAVVVPLLPLIEASYQVEGVVKRREHGFRIGWNTPCTYNTINPNYVRHMFVCNGPKHHKAKPTWFDGVSGLRKINLTRSEIEDLPEDANA